MKPVAFAALAAVLLAPAFAPDALAASRASPSGVEAAFGNTIVSTYPDGRTGMLWLKADGTYDAVGRRRTPSSGVWTVKGAKVCLKQKKPRAGPFPYCTEIKGGGVGTSWTARAVTGERITVKVVAGRVR